MSGSSGDKDLIPGLINLAERIVYYGAALFLLATIGLLFVSSAEELLKVGENGPLDTALGLLDKLLLIFIFAELLSTISTIVRDNQILAEPFLLIGLIAVVRRILAVTVSIDQSLGAPKFNSLLFELGVLTALVVALTAALYFTRSSERSIKPSDSG